MKSLTLPTIVCILITLSFSQGGFAQETTQPYVTRADAGKLQTQSGFTNDNSSLVRQWITVHDPGLPVKFNGTIGVGGKRESNDPIYYADFGVTAADDIAAIDFRFLLFNVWGEYFQTLRSSEIEDIAAGETAQFGPMWRIYDRNDLSEYYVSISYIASVRMLDGQILTGDTALVLEEARALMESFTEENLASSE